MASIQKPPARCGLLIVDKPAGISSRKVVDLAAKLVKPAKAGHAGTLDPLATGVLVVCVGATTRLMPLIHEFPKSYRAQFLLGQRSNTDDLEGEIEVVPDARPVARGDVEAQLTRFVGEIEQIPPAFSAVHVGGRRAYELARKGREVELTARTVTVHRIDLIRFEYPELELDIECSSGTYIRSIGRDLGEALGCGALMSGLVRTRIGPFDLADAVAFDDLNRDTLDSLLQPAAIATSHLPQRLCTADELELIRRGRPIQVGELSGTDASRDESRVAIIAPDASLAVVAERQGDLLQPRTVLLEQ